MTIPPDAVDRVSRLYNDGWTPADYELVFELTDPDIVWTAIESAPDSGVYRGHEGVRGYMADWHEDFDFAGEIHRIEDPVEIGDRLVCSQLGAGTGKASGARTELSYACVYEFGDDQRIVYVHEYATREEALEAASRP